MFRWGGFQRFATWIAMLDNGTAPTPAPPPSGGSLLLRDGVSYLLLRDGVSKLTLGH
jgi:hypothetical protein